MRSIPKPKRIRDEQYLAWIRTLPCLVSTDRHSGDNPVDAHHVLPSGGGKVGSKTDDRRAVPLCRQLHEWYHSEGRAEFESVFRLDLEAEIQRLNAEYDAQQKPLKRTVKKGAVSLKLSVNHCPNCSQPHQVPLSKVQFGKGVVHFWCITRRDYATARTK